MRQAGRGARTPFPSTPVALVVLAGLGAAGWFGKLPVWLVGVYFAMSVVAFVLYGHDKNAARDGAWRTSENELHAAALLCGWPGAMLAHGVLHHKSSKASFRGWFWLTVFLNCVAASMLLKQL